MQPAPDDPRLDRLVDLVVQIASGDLSARLEPSTAADSIDGVIVGINMLAEELELLYSDLEDRVAERTAQLEAAQRELKRLTLVDALTSLANRTLLDDRIEQALARTRRGAGPPTLLLLDLDGFKSINDSHGHAAGDGVLVEVARRLQNAARQTDTVARLGGDEFAVLLPDTTLDNALRVAERILGALHRPIQVAHVMNAVAASIGVSFGSPDQSADELVRDADIAMYAAKARGRNNIQVFQSAMHTAALSRKHAVEELRTALATGQLALHYQPLVELVTGRIVGVEALVRWPHPRRGLVPPAEFVLLAEETGLMAQLGQWVVSEAVGQQATWQTQLDLPESFTIHVNISPAQFHGADLAATVRRALQDHDVASSSLVLEMTEAGLDGLDADGRQTLAGLRGTGVGLALDDFGTGSSSINQLRRSAVDVVKIDRSLVEGLRADDRHTDLVRAIVQLIRALDLTAVAEGVETASQASALTAVGCTLAQGYYFSRPLPAGRMTELLRADLVRERLDSRAH